MRNKHNVPEPTYMLYKYPGEKFLHGDYFSTKIVKESELPEALDGEWFLNSKEAKESNSPKEEIVSNVAEAEVDQNADENRSDDVVSEETKLKPSEALDGESVSNQVHTKKRGGRKINADK